MARFQKTNVEKLILQKQGQVFYMDLLKVHKPLVNSSPKFRSIQSTNGTPTYKLAMI